MKESVLCECGITRDVAAEGIDQPNHCSTIKIGQMPTARTKQEETRPN